MTISSAYWRAIGDNPHEYVVYQVGLDADKPSTPPGVGAMFFATDTFKLYVAINSTTWKSVTLA